MASSPAASRAMSCPARAVFWVRAPQSCSCRRENFARLAATLDALSPLKVLGRGYSIAKGPGGIVKSVGDAQPGDGLKLRVSDGEIHCEVK